MKVWKQYCPNCEGGNFEVFETEIERDNGEYEMRFICTECANDWERNELTENKEATELP